MTHRSTILRALGAHVIIFSLAACGGDDGDTAGQQQTGGQTAAAVEIQDPATITGHIAFEGQPPAPRPVDMRDEPACAEQHEGDGADGQDVVVNDGRLQNVFVYISEGIDQAHPTPSDQVLIDQVGCIYHPRVVGVQTNQTIVFRNSDGLLHNIKAVPTVNRGFNISQPRNMDTQRTFSAAEVMIPVECNVHGWMHAYVGVLDHPYYAVSGNDGSFTIRNLPAGTYTVETWHERYGTQTRQVTVGPNETAEAVFTYNAGMAGRPVPLGAPIDPHGHAGTPGHAHGASPGAGR